jgi:hypothetical protein
LPSRHFFATDSNMMPEEITATFATASAAFQPIVG